jgi:tetratricopeptide (TPR) repeat protein
MRAQDSAIDSYYEQLIQEGKKAEMAGNLDQALASFESALKLKPKSTELEWKVAEIHLNRKEFEKALKYSERVLTVEPLNPDATRIAGFSAYALNKPELAVQYFKKAVAVYAKDQELHYWLGMALYSSHDARLALDELYRARLLDGKNTEVLYMIGKIHWEMCQQAWEEMVRVDPNSVRVKQVIAQRDEQSNLYVEAIEKYGAIIRQQPDTPGFHDALGRLYLHVGKFAEAEGAFRKELSLDRHSFTSYYGLADLAFRREDYASALENVTQAIQERADFGDPYVLLGRIQWHQGDRQKAVETLEHARRLSPADASLYYLLAHYYESLGRREDAGNALQTYRNLKGEQEKENEAGLR